MGVDQLSKLANRKLSLQVLKKFRLIYGAVRHHFREVEQSTGISGSQLWILREVGNIPEIGISQLAERLSIHQSTCSLLVEKLVARGLIRKERSQQDQRRVGLNLLPQAELLLAHAPGPAEGVLPKALLILSEDSLQALDESLSKVIQQLNISDHSHADKPLADL
jgi:DNA-binding MarR family transcriptional regulator